MINLDGIIGIRAKRLIHRDELTRGETISSTVAQHMFSAILTPLNRIVINVELVCRENNFWTWLYK